MWCIESVWECIWFICGWLRVIHIVMDFGGSSSDFPFYSSPKVKTLWHQFCAWRYQYSVFITYISNMMYWECLGVLLVHIWLVESHIVMVFGECTIEFALHSSPKVSTLWHLYWAWKFQQSIFTTYTHVMMYWECLGVYLVHLWLVEGHVVGGFWWKFIFFCLCSSPKVSTLRHLHWAWKFQYSIFTTYIRVMMYWECLGVYLVHIRLVEGHVVEDFGESSSDFAFYSSPKVSTLWHQYRAWRSQHSVFTTYISYVMY